MYAYGRKKTNNKILTLLNCTNVDSVCEPISYSLLSLFYVKEKRIDLLSIRQQAF
jgi:hypothetical protein